MVLDLKEVAPPIHSLRDLRHLRGKYSPFFFRLSWKHQRSEGISESNFSKAEESCHKISWVRYPYSKH